MLNTLIYLDSIMNKIITTSFTYCQGICCLTTSFVNIPKHTCAVTEITTFWIMAPGTRIIKGKS